MKPFKLNYSLLKHGDSTPDNTVLFIVGRLYVYVELAEHRPKSGAYRV
jgi:hypothetical protein